MLFTLTLVLLTQTPPSTDPNERAALAAEKAAEAAQRAADAAQRSAQAIEKLATPVAPPTATGAVIVQNPWHGTAGISFISLTGNASTMTMSLAAAFERDWTDWHVGVKASGSYGQARLPDTSESSVVALNGALGLRGARKFNDSVASYLQAGLETDHVKSVEYRALGEAGASITWLELKEGPDERAMVRTDIALKYTHESRYQYFPTAMKVPDAELLGPKFGFTFRYALSKTALFSQDAEITPNILGSSRVVMSAQTKLSSRLSQVLSLAASFLVNYDSAPAPGRVATDTALTLGVEAKI